MNNILRKVNKSALLGEPTTGKIYINPSNHTASDVPEPDSVEVQRHHYGSEDK